MNILEEKLIIIESRLQLFVEGTAERLFAGKPLSEMFAHRLMTAVEEGLHTSNDGSIAAPERLILCVCPMELDLFHNSRWLSEIETAFRSIGSEQGIKFPEYGFIQVESREQLLPGEMLVIPYDDTGSISQTSDVAAPESHTHEIPGGVFLIVNGTQIIPLDRSVINLGRRPDNHLVIDDGRVSRTHAQIRLVRGQYVVFDLDSRGGTFVNGSRVFQQVLHPGDVISLAGVPIVFGQDSLELGITQEFSTIQ